MMTKQRERSRRRRWQDCWLALGLLAGVSLSPHAGRAAEIGLRTHHRHEVLQLIGQPVETYPYCHEHVAMLQIPPHLHPAELLAEARAKLKTNTITEEFIIIGKPADTVDEAAFDRLVNMIAKAEHAGWEWGDLIVYREPVYATRPPGQALLPGPWRDRRLISAEDIASVRARLVRAHAEGVIKKCHYRICGLIHSWKNIDEDAKAFINTHLDGLYVEMNTWNNTWRTDGVPTTIGKEFVDPGVDLAPYGWPGTIDTARMIKWCLDHGKRAGLTTGANINDRWLQAMYSNFFVHLRNLQVDPAAEGFVILLHHNRRQEDGRLAYFPETAEHSVTSLVKWLIEKTQATAPQPALPSAAQVDRPPNIVFILADDLGIVDVGAYAMHLTGASTDGRFYETPNIDRLVASGIAFSQAYANQLCSPTRAAILTGRYPARLGVTTATPLTKTFYNQGLSPPAGCDPHDAFAHSDPIGRSLAWKNAHSCTAVSPTVPTIPRVLATHDCAYLGKWHLGGHGAQGRQPRDHGFEELAYFDAGGSPYFNWKQLWDRKKLFFPTMPQDVLMVGTSGTPTGEAYLTDDLTAQAIDYLEQRARMPEKPFLLYFAHFSVHTPLQAKPETIARFVAKPTKGAGGQNNATYAAMVSHLDDSVGVVIKALEQYGLRDNTLVIFTSDNGGVEYTKPPATDNSPFKGGKACLTEGGIRVPLVFSQPGRYEQGVWCDTPVNCIDFLPTFARLTGNDIPAGVDGIALDAVLRQPAAACEPRTFYWHYPFNVAVNDPDTGLPLTPHSAIRHGAYKLIWDWQGSLKLYQIEADPYEQTDLAAKLPDQTQQLFQQLKSWLRQNVKPQYVPGRNPDYIPAADSRDRFVDLWN